MRTLWRQLVKFTLRPRWVAFVTSDGGPDHVELGLKIWGVVFALYKADVYVATTVTAERRPDKHEFGTSLEPDPRHTRPVD